MRTRAWWFTAPPGAQRDNDHLVSLLCFLSTEEWKGRGIARVHLLYVISRCSALPTEDDHQAPPSWRGLILTLCACAKYPGLLRIILVQTFVFPGELLPSMITRLSVHFTLADWARLSPAELCYLGMSTKTHANCSSSVGLGHSDLHQWSGSWRSVKGLL